MPSYAPRMADVTKRAGLERPAVIAIGFAVVALLTSMIAVIVVMRRQGSASEVVAAPSATSVIERTVGASEVMKLKRDVVEKVLDDNAHVVGVRIKDEALRTSLGFEPSDVISAINGRALKREFDVYDAVLGMSMMDASIVYVEIVRDKQPALVRWKLDGDLRAARRDPVARRPTPSPSTPFTNPFTASADPLVDSIRRIDALHYEVPRSTFDRLLANPDAYARHARIVPAMRNGQPDGFKLYVMSSGSIWRAIGLANGDTIRSVNGHDLSTPDKLVALYTRLKDATELQILVGRRSGGDETIRITIK